MYRQFLAFNKEGHRGQGGCSPKQSFGLEGAEFIVHIQHDLSCACRPTTPRRVPERATCGNLQGQTGTWGRTLNGNSPYFNSMSSEGPPAQEALLESAGWAILGWEPWLKLPNGSHVHPLMGGDFQRAAMEDWMTYVQRSAQLCRQMLKEEQHNWDQGTFLPQNDPATSYWQEKIPSMMLYFCLFIVPYL